MHFEGNQGRRGLEGRGAMAPNFSKSSDFRKFNALLENFRTFGVGKDKGFEFYYIPLPYRCNDASVGNDIKTHRQTYRKTYARLSYKHPSALQFKCPT